MPLATRPEVVIAEIIEAATILVHGTDLFSGPPKPWKGTNIPRSAVFVYSLLSYRPIQYVGSDRKALRDIRVSIFVRRRQDEFESGQSLAREIWDAINQADTSAYVGYVAVMMAESDPIYIGMDDTDDHRWVMSARLLHKG